MTKKVSEEEIGIGTADESMSGMYGDVDTPKEPPKYKRYYLTLSPKTYDDLVTLVAVKALDRETAKGYTLNNLIVELINDYLSDPEVIEDLNAAKRLQARQNKKKAKSDD